MRKPPNFARITWFCCALAALLAIIGCNASSHVEPPAPAATVSSGEEMALIPAGKFIMGSESDNADEQPKHEVQISAILMDCTEVTQERYDKFALGNPSHFKGANLPVEQISWADAALYCNARSRAEGLSPCYDEQTAECNYAANGYRLPTEAEWEYACRAGSTSDYGFGQDPRSLKDFAWHADNAGKKTHAVRQKRPNAWGLYDMHGNVAEWCNDRYSEQYYASSDPENPRGPKDGERYVLRGGAWNCRAEQCRSSSRAAEDPGFQDACFARDAIGFRCVRTAPPADGGPKQP